MVIVLQGVNDFSLLPETAAHQREIHSYWMDVYLKRGFTSNTAL